MERVNTPPKDDAQAARHDADPPRDEKAAQPEDQSPHSVIRDWASI